jgi:hypothetical protein
LSCLLSGCPGDDGGPSSDDAAATTANASTGSQPNDCSAQLPGCMMAVELCQAGQCECQCADTPTTGAEGTGTGGGMCPNDAVPGNLSGVCEQPATSCETIGGCCRCEVIAGCGDDPIWWCVEIVPDPTCALPIPPVDDPCNPEGALCSYCDDADSPVLRACNGGTWQDPGFPSCAG